MKTLILVSLLLLSGCTEIMQEWQLKKAIEICLENGGIDYISVHMADKEYVMCTNGTGNWIEIK